MPKSHTTQELRMDRDIDRCIDLINKSSEHLTLIYTLYIERMLYFFNELIKWYTG